MELEQGLILPPHDIAVEYKKLVRTLFFDEEGVDDNQYDKLEQRRRELTEQYSFSYTPFYENGKVGLKCYTGKTVIPAVYDDFSLLCCPNDDEFPCETIMAKSGGKCGLVSMDGSARELTPFIYDGWSYVPGSYLVSIGSKSGIISESGRTIIPCEYDEIRTANEFWAYYKDGKHGFVEFLGPDSYLVTDPIFSESHFNENGNLAVKYHDMWGFVGDDGRFVTDEEKAYLKKDVELEDFINTIIQENDIIDPDGSENESIYIDTFSPKR